MVEKKLNVIQAILFYGKLLYGDKFNLDNSFRKNMYYNFYLHITQNPKCPYPLNKSLLYTGDVGVGKSAMFKVYQQIFHSYKILHAKKLDKDFEDLSEDKNIKFPMQVLLGLHGKAYKKTLLIDDLATEKAELFLFKNKLTIMDELLWERHELFVEEKIKTYIVTNFDTNALEDRYGPRLFDRIKEMTTVITWSGTSLR